MRWSMAYAVFLAPCLPIGVLSQDYPNVTGNQRTAALPNTPTAKEAGYPDFDVTGWYGFVIPAGTPREIVAKLNAQINRLLETKGVRDSLIAAGFEPRGGSPEEFGALIRRDHERWGKVVKISGVKVQ